jgi:chromosome partitioning protein
VASRDTVPAEHAVATAETPTSKPAPTTTRPADLDLSDWPPAPPHTRLIALLNQKGGVGKTTSTVNLGAALARAGFNVLLIDLDPQAHLSLHVGIDPDDLTCTTYDLMTDDNATADDALHRVGDRLWLLPAEVNLAGAEAELAPKLMTGRAQQILKQKVQLLLEAHGLKCVGFPVESQSARFDYVLIDCPPSLGLLTINALTLANEVVVPMQAHFLALQGLSKLLETVRLVKQSFNPALAVTGMLLCMHDAQTLLAGEVIADLTGFLASARDQDVPWRDAVVFEPPVRRNIKLAESPSFGQTVFDYAPGCAGARDYLALARAVAATWVPKPTDASA